MTHPIPTKLNLLLAALVLVSGTALLATSGGSTGFMLVMRAILYGLAMNTGYALIHEAEHGILHPVRAINDLGGSLLALFFPAPFHLIRQGHLGHHMRNRSDDEAFDFYFEGESRLWRWLQLYGTLTGFFWLTIALSNFISALAPGLLVKPVTPFDRSTTSLQESLNPRYLRRIQIEAWAVFAFHGALLWIFEIPPWRWLAVLSGFGVMWSAMQYAHHFGTERHVLRGARNLRTFFWLDWLWLNHNWHLNHHLQPTVPWIYLPTLFPERKRGSLFLAYLRMWRGPRFSRERVENRFEGRLIP